MIISDSMSCNNDKHAHAHADTPALLNPVLLLLGVSVVCHVLFVGANNTGARPGMFAEMQYTSRLVLSLYVAYKIE